MQAPPAPPVVVKVEKAEAQPEGNHDPPADRHKSRALDHLSRYVAQLEDSQRDLYMANQALTYENAELHARLAGGEQTLTRENAELHAQLAKVQEQLSISVRLRHMLEKAHYTSELLSTTLAEERAGKRQREPHFVVQ